LVMTWMMLRAPRLHPQSFMKQQGGLQTFLKRKIVFLFFPSFMRNPFLRNTPHWVLLFAICLPDVKDTDARNHEKATYYPDYAIYHDVDRYNR